MKPKTVVGFSILVLLAFMILIGSTPAIAQEAKAFVGDWAGAVSLPEADIEIVCHFQLDAEGTLIGTIDSPSQEAYGLKLGNITVEGNKISFGVDDPNVPGDPKLEGVLDESGTKIKGDFSQGGAEGTFELIKQ